MTLLAAWLERMLPFIRLAAVILFVYFLGWLIARALNRRISRDEEELFVRERADDAELVERERRKKATRGHAARRDIQAENIRRIYAALLVQADAAGLARREAETPYEFLPRLSDRFPQLAGEFGRITNAYVSVHYAQRAATATEVGEIRALWHKARGEMARHAARLRRETRKTK
jgi:hypothetical protein